MRILSVALLISLFFGCLSNQAFTSQDVREPCSIVTADEVAAICGYENLSAQGLSRVYFTKCDYSLGGENLVSIAYYPETEGTYEEYKEGIETEFPQTNPSLYAEIVQEDLGIGDKSLLVKVFDNETKEPVGIHVAAFEKRSLIGVFTFQFNQTNRCFSEEKAKRIAQLAIQRPG